MLLLLAGYASAVSVAQRGWTKETVENLTISLVDPVQVEFLEFAPKGKVAVRWGTKNLWTNPWLDWKVVHGRIRIYEDGKIAEELTLIRKEDSFFIIRLQSGKVGRFKIVRETSSKAR
jgi:hypothetical protein